MVTDIKPWVVGEVGVYVLGVEGTITALDEGTITIAGMTLPKGLNPERGIRYLSMCWPPDGEDCDREHCAGDCESNETESTERVRSLEAAIRDHHDAEHGAEPFMFCAAQPCREVNR